MTSFALITALQIAAKRRRTPHMRQVEQDGLASITVTFDRPMDVLDSTSVIRTCDSTNGVVDWTNGTWTNDRTFVSTDSDFVASFSGTARAIYMSGNIRDKTRFRLGIRHQTTNIFFLETEEIDGGVPAGSFTDPDTDGGTPDGMFTDPDTDGGTP